MSSDRSTGLSRCLGFVRDSWRGDERLVFAFWCGGLASMCVTATTLCVALIGGMICLGPISIVLGVSPIDAFEMAVGVIFLVGFGAAAVWWLVSVWRCAPNTRRRLWFFLARGVIVFEAAAGLALLA